MLDTTIAHYKITSKLGQGGMGEVYCATDTKLGREVAIKVLPEGLATDPERLARFQREAELLASLNHSNIAAIYGLEDAGASKALVLELVEGETLADRLVKGPMTIEDALETCLGIAEALEAAHGKGIIHRDLKPANVKFASDGKVKVLDFGLAKALDRESSVSSRLQGDGGQSHPLEDDSPTITADYTMPGTILGTAAYMSPEQARGKTLDKRTDIWSFGCVLFECLTGRKPFQGEDVSGTLARILEREPDWAVLPKSTPPLVALLLRKCLAKKRSQRLRDIGDAQIDLDQGCRAESEQVLLRERGESSRASRFLLWVPMVLLLVFISFQWRSDRVASVRNPRAKQFSIPLEASPGQRLPGERVSPIDFSADSQHLVYSVRRNGRSQLEIRSLDTGVSLVLTNTLGALDVQFLPDGERIIYTTKDNELRIVNWRSRNESSRICSLKNASPFSRFIVQDEVIYFCGNEGLFGVPVSGGIPRLKGGALPEIPNIQRVNLMLYVPARNAFLVRVTSKVQEGARLAQTCLLPLDASEESVILDANIPDIRFVDWEKNIAVLHNLGTLYAGRFDSSEFTPIGEPVVVMEHLDLSAMTISNDGTVAIIEGLRTSLIEPGQAVWVDRQGKQLGFVGERAAAVSFPRLAPPNGDQLSVTDSLRVKVVKLTDASPPLTLLSAFANRRGTWTGDGNALLYNLDAGQAARGLVFSSLHSDETRFLTESWEPKIRIVCACHPDKDIVMFYEWRGDINVDGQRDLYWLDYGALETVAEPFLVTPSDKSGAAFSRDGRWVAYVDDHSNGQSEIFVLPFPRGEARPRPVSLGGGAEPVWSKTTDELFYWNGNRFMSVTFRDDGDFEILQRSLLFESSDFERGIWGNANYDVHPKDEKFIMIKAIRQPRIRFIVNWFSDLEEHLNLGRE